MSTVPETKAFVRTILHNLDLFQQAEKEAADKIEQIRAGLSVLISDSENELLVDLWNTIRLAMIAGAEQTRRGRKAIELLTAFHDHL